MTDRVPTVAALLAERTRTLGDQPLLTCYDDVTGGRTELSYATLDNWAAKLANLLSEEFAVTPGDGVGIDLDGHWSAAAVMLACWKVGAAVRLPDGDGAVSVSCVHERHVDRHGAAPLIVVGDGLAAEPTTALTLGADQLVLSEEVHVFADDYDDQTVEGTTAAVVSAAGTVDHTGLLHRARSRRAAVGDHDRIGLAVDLEDPTASEWLVTALLSGTGIVCTRSARQVPDWKRLTIERVDVVFGDADLLAAAGTPPSDITIVTD